LGRDHRQRAEGLPQAIQVTPTTTKPQNNVMTYPTTADYLQWHSDPGHAWLEVSLTDVVRSKVAISPYSYVKGRRAYLEEDCDAPRFLKHVFGDEWQQQARLIGDKNYDKEAPIRDYEPYE
jgi:hypothetical protein